MLSGARSAIKGEAENRYVRELLPWFPYQLFNLFFYPAGPPNVYVPIVDAYRTLCIAPSPEVKAVFQGIREFDSVAYIG